MHAATRPRPAQAPARLVDRLAALLMYLGLCAALALLGAWVENTQPMP